MKKQIILMSVLSISLMLLGQCANRVLKDKTETKASVTVQNSNSSKKNTLSMPYELQNKQQRKSLFH
jgi:hypothetical protein